MKRNIYIIVTMLAVCCVDISYSQISPDPMSIEIIPEDYGNPYEVTSFIEGDKPYTNSGTIWQSVASEFRGFNYFSTNSNNTYKGRIVPSATGEIYLVASGTLTIAGWTKTAYTGTYKLSETSTKLYIFKRSVNYGDTIAIPTNSNWAGLSPIAHNITIKEIDPLSLTLVKSIPAENEIVYSNLQKEIKLYFNKEVELSSGELFLNGASIPLNTCLVEGNVASIPVKLDASSSESKSYVFIASSGCFKEKSGINISNSIVLNFKTSKTVAYPSHYSAQIDVFYKHINSLNTRMDIYCPTNPIKPSPIIVRLHGGGWKEGLKEDYVNFDVYFNQGYAVANVEYRLTGEAKAPAAVQDARGALIYLLNHAEELNIDKRKIVLLGGSAGGHLALTAGYLQNNRIHDNDAEAYADEIKIMAVINKYGITNLRDLMSYSSLVEWLGGGANDEDFVKSLSPVDLVGNNTPPTYIVHGDKDATVPYSQSLSLEEALKLSNVKYQFTTIPNGGHGGFSSAYNKQIDEEVVRFINYLINEQDTNSDVITTEENQFEIFIKNRKIQILSDEIESVILYNLACNQLLVTSENIIDVVSPGLYILKIKSICGINIIVRM